MARRKRQSARLVFHERIDRGRRHPARVVVLDDLLEGRKPPVVHVRPGERGIAQRGHLKLSRVEGQPGHGSAPGIGLERRVEPVVAEQVVRELQAGFRVAVEAVPAELAAGRRLRIAAFPQEHFVAPEFAVAQRGFPAPPPVEFRIGRHHRPQELRDGLGHAFGRDGTVAEGPGEQVGVVGVCGQAGHGVGPRQGHLVRVWHGLEDLLLERQGAPVPKVARRPPQVHERHRIPRPYAAVDPGAVRVGVCKSVLREVAGATADSPVDAQVHVPKKQPPQRHPLHGQRVVRRDVHRREERRNLQRVGRRLPRAPFARIRIFAPRAPREHEHGPQHSPTCAAHHGT